MPIAAFSSNRQVLFGPAGSRGQTEPAASAADKARQGADDQPEQREHREKGQKAHDAEGDIGKFQRAGMRHVLADLDGKGDDDDQRQNVKPRHDDFVPAADQREKKRMDQKEQQHPEGADDQKMQVLVGQNAGKTIVDVQDLIVQQRDQPDDPVKSSFHGGILLI